MPDQAHVVLNAPDPRWSDLFAAERELLAPILGGYLVGPIEHIGSTAVPELVAKPIIDIMAGVRDLVSSRPAIAALAPLAYHYAPYKDDVMHWLCKPDAFNRTHHLHLVPFDSPLWRERLAFRDALRADAGLRARYAALKVDLAARFRADREAYTEGKSAFVAQAIARRL